jgi:predicted O-methyltransferase YrrM
VSTTAANWFDDEPTFRQLCGDAQSQARGESAQEFAAEMVRKANEHGLGTYLSEKQLKYLCTLADWHVPKRLI